MKRYRVACVATVLFLASASAFAQLTLNTPTAVNVPMIAKPSGDGAYLMGPGDQISVQVLEVEEFSGGKSARLDDAGFITLPFAGRVQASGLTARQLEETLTVRLAKSIVNPVVSVSIVTQRTQPVLLSGAIKTTGQLNVPPGQSLFEVLALAGGPLPNAGYRLRLSRRVSAGEIPLPGAKKESDGQSYTVEIPLRELLEGSSAVNIPILPNDFISVPPAQVVYVIGDVKTSGAVTLGDEESISALQAFSRSGGGSKTSALAKAYIERVSVDDKQQKIPVDLDKIMNGKSLDVKLMAKDILIIPGGGASQSVIDKMVTTIMAIGTGALLRF